MISLLPELTILFHPANPPSLRAQMEELYRFRTALAPWGPLFSTWYLGGDSKEEALMYEAFDEQGVTTAAYAVLKTRNAGGEMATDIGLWNGQEGAQSAGMGYLIGAEGRPCTVNLRPRVEPDLRAEAISTTLKKAVEIWAPGVITAHPPSYAFKKVFKDRPGVGWMLYLPQVLTVQQVPEAGALIPVPGDKTKQTGTIIVSVTDQRFSSDNPEHVKIANKIEVRLVDQDLLPRYADL